MAENKEYFSQEYENGSIQISEEVAASIAAAAILEVEGVCGLSSNISTDIAEMLGVKSLSKGVRLTSDESGALHVDCNVVVKFGQSVFSLARTIQETVQSNLESITGLKVAQVNVNICGISLPKDGKR